MKTETKAITLKELIGDDKVLIYSDNEPKLAWDKQDEWQQKANGFRVELKYQGRQYTLDFWQGKGITADPTAESVLKCLLCDCQLAQDSFEDFCANLGYDTDSRKAFRVYQACKRENKRLRRLLGDDFEAFLHSDR